MAHTVQSIKSVFKSHNSKVCALDLGIHIWCMDYKIRNGFVMYEQKMWNGTGFMKYK